MQSVGLFVAVSICGSTDSAQFVIVMQESTPGILNCSEMRSFWISWSLGHIKLGHGSQVDDRLITQWRDPQPLSVGMIAISTGSSSQGTWHFSNIQR